ncbi:MAG: hypothetical protein ACXAC7_08995 [Candidatus Hodarchaeales archaeon]|jgi:effector-binding domain-containing protein
MSNEIIIKHYTREETLFAGIRKAIKKRDELNPSIKKLKADCEQYAIGPLTLIFRFDTPVDGFDAEIGFPVSTEINRDEIKTTKLRKMHFFSITAVGSVDNIRNASQQVYNHMNKVGLSPDLELVERYLESDPDHPENNVTEVQGAFLHWSEVYKEQLYRFLDQKLTDEIWADGGNITPFTLVDERVQWVADTIERLKNHTDEETQFQILSNVALRRPREEIIKYKKFYKETGDINKVFNKLNKYLESTPTGGFLEKQRIEDNALKLSKVPRNGKAYIEATTHEEKRRAFCFCSLIREAKDPKVDPIFCYRAAGWARQFWEEVLDIKFTKCRITRSILKKDDYCAWEYSLPNDWRNKISMKD